MLITLDVGNTNTAIGLFVDDTLSIDWRLATDRYRTADEWGLLLRSLMKTNDIPREEIDAVAIASVVPPLDSILERAILRYFDLEPFFISWETDLGIGIDYAVPSEIGADRLVNAVGASNRYGKPLIVIDFGTATTFDIVNEAGNYSGGVICPGIGISSQALFEKAAKLPRIDIRKPAGIIGGSTLESMQSGLYYGYLEQIRGIIRRIRIQLGEETKVVITGGLSRVFKDDLGDGVVSDLTLTLEGMRLIYQRNNR